jgi:hypothetical protein
VALICSARYFEYTPHWEKAPPVDASGNCPGDRAAAPPPWTGKQIAAEIGPRASYLTCTRDVASR